MFDIGSIEGAIVRGLVLAALAVMWTVLLVRLVGLRAFSKMTAFDFVTTIATGSLIAQAGTRSDWVAFAQCLAAIVGIFAVQFILAMARKKLTSFGRLIKNQPILLMEHGAFIEDALAATRVSRPNVMEKLRACDVARLEEVRAVVLETTGDISVLTGREVDSRLLEGVARV